MDAMASQITSLTIVYATVYLGADQRNIKSSRHWPLCGVHRWPVNSPHEWPEARKMLPFDDLFMNLMHYIRLLLHKPKFDEVGQISIKRKYIDKLLAKMNVAPTEFMRHSFNTFSMSSCILGNRVLHESYLRNKPY